MPKKIKPDDSIHHEYGPSTSLIWTRCAGAIKAKRDAIEASKTKLDEGNDFADEGNAAHAYGSLILDDPDRIVDELDEGLHVYTSTTGVEWHVTEEMIYHVGQYVDYVRGFGSLNGVEILNERNVTLDTMVPGDFGRADCTIMVPGELINVDLKFGAYGKVEARNNTQTLMYSIGAFREFDWLYDFQTITMVVHQSRMDNIDEWTITRDELIEWETKIRLAYEATLVDDPVRTPGTKQCKYCLANTTCRKYATFNLDSIIKGFDNAKPILPQATELPIPDINSLSHAEIGKLMLRFSDFTKWMGKIQKYAREEAIIGNPIPEWKLVKGKGSRDWRDEETVIKTLRLMLGIDGSEPRKLVSPAQALKLKHKKTGVPLKKSKRLLSLIERTDGKPLLAPETDKRPALITDIAAGFDNAQDENQECETI